MPLLFGAHPDLEAKIEAGLDYSRFTATFAELGDVPPAAGAVLPLKGQHSNILENWRQAGRNVSLHPSPRAAALCTDKQALNQFLIDQGFADLTPPLRQPGAPYPYIWKRRHGYWGRQARVIRSPADEAGLDMSDPDWFAQELVPGEIEYAGHILRDRGRIWYAATSTYRLARPDGVLGAFEPPLGMTFQRGCQPLRLFAGILEALEYEGTACIDYKLVDGTPQIFEINPRFGASLVCDINAYVDYYLAALGARQEAAGSA